MYEFFYDGRMWDGVATKWDSEGRPLFIQRLKDGRVFNVKELRCVEKLEIIISEKHHAERCAQKLMSGK